ncbi:MAG: TIR domain-containing protein [Bacteroidota bacterium]|nr:TIR domain-containing protein [Bacteroidota bacterium]
MAARRKVFISYHFERDRHYKNLLLAWDSNGNFDFHMRDYSADISIGSTEASVIKRAISTKINKGNYFIVIVGKSTHKCQWVKWEIAKAKELNKKIIAVKIDRRIPAPDELYRSGVSWAYTFRLNSISNAIAKV